MFREINKDILTNRRTQTDRQTETVKGIHTTMVNTDAEAETD